MSDKFILTGGARIGMANASYPFADLYVDKDVLKINASIVGNLVFQSKDIVSIEPYTLIPLIGQGIKINHKVENYNPKVIFWTFKNPTFVIDEIKKTGFLLNFNSEISSNDLEKIIKKQNNGGLPIKKSVAVFFILAWNILFLSDIISFFLKDKNEGSPIGIGIISAIGLIFISSILVILSKKFRNLILKKDRNFGDIRKFVSILALISAIMFIALTSGYINK